ncbi:hypothetical protein HDU98_009197 [Podochytrium sp. JEL0797]|nr:hypothetical protein HDU98_009197 [Podochytrium sp. JEL0797]
MPRKTLFSPSVSSVLPSPSINSCTAKTSAIFPADFPSTASTSPGPVPVSKDLLSPTSQPPLLAEVQPLFEQLYEWMVSLWMALLLNIIRLGPIPKHVAFIMDGNRRFARNRGMEVSKGHAEGADTLEETLDWCLKLGVKTVSVYAFSTENFSRDKEKEVDPIMKLSSEKFRKFASHSELIKKHDIAVRVHGRLSLLPPSVLQAAGLATKMTHSNQNATLNICMPYTSREEILYAVKRLVRGCEDGVLEVDDISEEVLEQCFWTGALGCEDGVGGGPLDMLVRTSGEVRLSDFMLWQVCIKFMPNSFP